jgi:hypothetical protein
VTLIRHGRIHQSMRADRISEHGKAHNRDYRRSSSSRCRELSNRSTSSHLASSIHVFIGEGRNLDATKPRRKIVYRNHIVRVLGTAMPQYTPSKLRHRCVLKKDPSWQAALRRSRRFRIHYAHRKQWFGQLQSTSKDSLDTYLSSPGSIRLACPIINTDDDPTSQKKVESGAANQRRGMPILGIK